MPSHPPESQPTPAVHELKNATEASSEAQLQHMFAEITAQVSAESSSDRLAAWPTPLRYAAAAALSVALPLVLWLAHQQVLPPTFSLERQLIILGSYALCLASILTVGLRPLHRPLLPRPWLWLHMTGPFLLVLAMALWPTDVHVDPATVGHSPLGCLLSGTAFGLSLFILLRYLDRGQRFGALVSAAGATILGNLALQVQCADTGIAHRVGGHAGVGLLLLLGLAVVHFVRRRTA